MENPATSTRVVGNDHSVPWDSLRSPPNGHILFLDPRGAPVTLEQFNICLRQELQGFLNNVDL